MKKYIYMLAMLLAAASLSSCEKEDVGATAVVDLAGEWIVTVDAVDASGEVVGEDFFGIGQFLLLTYNDNSNAADKLVVDDMGQFWGMTAVLGANLSNLTFGGTAYIYDDEDTGEEVTATVADGRVVINGTLSPYYQRPVDAIEFYVNFSDDPYPAMYGFDRYLVHGFRRTGFVGEDIIE